MAIFNQILANPTIDALLGQAKELLATVPAIAVIGVLLVLSLIETFAGKKLFGLQKFIAFFAAGFVGGVCFVAPLVQSFFANTLVVGLVVGVIAALLYRLIYFLAYAGGIGFVTYYVLFNALLLPATVTAYTKGNLVVSIVAAVVVVVIALLLRKWLETLALAGVGAFGIWYSVSLGLTVSQIVLPYENYIMLAVVGIFTLFGFIVQVKNRKRY